METLFVMKAFEDGHLRLDKSGKRIPEALKSEFMMIMLYGTAGESKQAITTENQTEVQQRFSFS